MILSFNNESCVCCWKQEGLVLLVDIGPAMHSVLPDVEKTCSLLMQKKVNKIPFSFHSQIITLFCLCYRVFIVFGFVCCCS